MTQEQYIGIRVQIHPRLDDWMKGDRYGEIVGVGRPTKARPIAPYKVKLDKSGKILTLDSTDIKTV